MASLKDIRRRIVSTKNTQQITKAMKMVSAAKLRRAQQMITSARPFAEKLEEATSRVIAELQNASGISDPEKRREFLLKLNPLLNDGTSAGEAWETPKKKIAVIVVASDRGLCGAYNTNVIRFALRYIKDLRSEPNNEVSLFFVGRRANDMLSKRGFPGHWFADFWSGKFSVSKSDQLSRHFIEKFLEGEFNSIQVVFTQFKSALTQVVGVKQILPMTVPAAKEGEAIESRPFIYEPGREELLKTLLPQLVRTQFYRVFADSLASEFGARMTSMDNATRNAGEMISKLTLEANRVRQASITKELMEIVGGAEALKG